MISLTTSETVRATSHDVFEAIETVQKLARFKREISNFRLVRNETGLQIIDTTLRFIIMKFDTRLKYTTMPNRYAELKKLKGRLKEYQCTYTITEKGNGTEITARLTIKLPFGPIGFLISLLARPLYSFRLKRELLLIKTSIKER